MIIDNFYDEIDKSHFYIGMISQVYRESCVIQVENLSWLAHRKIKLETLIPNTINYYVIIDSVQGLFIGEIFQSKVSNSDSVHDSMNNGITENVYPEVSVEIISVMRPGDTKFKLAGFQTVGITDKVYIANQKIIKEYLYSIEINHENEETLLSSFSKFSNLQNQEINLKPSTLFDRHIIAIGTTNSGKSTSSLSILDKLVKNQKKILLIDPTGEYSDAFSDSEISKLKLGIDTVLSVGEVSTQQWAMLFETNDATQPAILAEAIKSLRFQKKTGQTGIYRKANQAVTKVDSDMASVTVNDKNFILSDLTEQIAAETNKMGGSAANKIYVQNDFNFNSNQWLVQKVQYKLNNTSFANFFSDDSTKKNIMNELDNFSSKENSSLYINASEIGTADGLGGMIIDLISNYLINKQKDKIQPFVLFIDEVHRYTKTSSSETNYYTGLTSIAREGRKKGIFLFLTSQSPQDVSGILLSQIGTLLVHRLTHPEELKAIQNHLSMNKVGQIRKLNQGEAILASINLLQDIHLKVDKCNRLHNNKTPLL